MLSLLWACAADPDLSPGAPQVHAVDDESRAADSAPDSVLDSPPDSPPSFPDLSPRPGLGLDQPRALLLILDGTRAEELTGADPSPLSGLPGPEYTPELWEAFQGGTIIRALQNPGVTSTAPAHAGLFSGRVLPYQNLPGDLQPTVYRPEVPGLFQGESARCPKDRRRFLGNGTMLMDTDGTLYPDAAGEADPGRYDWTGDLADDLDMLDQVRDEIADDTACLIVINVHSMDMIGHGGDLARFLNRTQEAGRAVAELRQWIREEAPAPWREALIAVTSDHGRHDRDWREHGDGCLGCRAVPLFIEGPGVPAQVTDEPWTIHDLGGWIADHLSLSLPFRSGLPAPWGVHPPPDGPSTFAVASGLRLLRVAQDDPARRSRIELSGTVLSSPDALDTAAPALAVHDDHAWACFLEQLDEAAERPWRPRCLARAPGDFWREIGLPDDELSPWARLTLSADTAPNGAPRLTVAWPSNANTDDQTGADGAWIGEYTDATGWVTSEHPVWAPMPPALLRTTDGPLILVGGADDMIDSRYARSLYLFAPSGLIASFDLSPLLQPSRRLDRAVLSAVPALPGAPVDVEIAAIGHDISPGDASRSAIYWWRSFDGMRQWSDPHALPSPWPVLPHLTPRRAGSRVVWGVEMGGVSGFCSAGGADTAATCAPVGARWVSAFSIDQIGPESPWLLYASTRDDGDPAWKLVALPLP